jgi:iron complex outermembrane receptor protein
MVSQCRYSKNNPYFLSSLIVLMCCPLAELNAQALEEITVTAQRREQSLREVPISMEAITGAQLVLQGFREMDDLSNFIPSVEIDFTTQEQDISIRGYGTVGANLSADQAAPTFVDGIHFSRGSMIQAAFVDLERIEVLRGPQPVFFGQNATVGAFNLITRKPTDEWQGNVTLEAGNFGRLTADGGIGGPISDTLGIRIAGRYDDLEGYLTNITTGHKFPERQDAVGRVTFQWKPSDRLTATLKLEAADWDRGADGAAYCLSTPPEERTGYQLDAIIPGLTSFEDGGNEVIDLKQNCFSELGLSEGEKIFAPIDDVREQSARAGILDIRQSRLLAPQQASMRNDAFDEGKSFNTYLDLNYQFSNEIEFTSLTGLIDYDRGYQQDNRNSPFLTSPNFRSEDLESWSQEFRLTSPVGESIEWMLGLYYQKEDLDIESDSFRANIRRSRRYNNAWQDSEYKSIFGAVTFNFMDGKASLDLGGRYVEVEKTAFLQGFGATWIFDIDPTPGTVAGGCDEDTEECFDDDDQAIDLGDGLWTHEFGSRRIPDVWDLAAPVSMTALDTSIRSNVRPGDVPHFGTRKDSDFNPQVVFRYRPNEDWSLYAKWAEAFKAGGFETGVSSLPDFDEAFTFKPEFSENFEIGAKGTFWGGRVQANVAAFVMEVVDLQIETTVLPEPGEIDAPTPTVNAGLQRVKGVEFDVTAAVTDRLTLSFSGALLDGKMVDFTGAGCTPSEFRNADVGPCISEDESAEITGIDPEVDEDGAYALAGFIDRSGSDAPRTPDWKFVLMADYELPIGSNYKANFNSKMAFSDGYIDNVEEFDRIVDWGQHENINVSIGFGDVDDTWQLSLWGRNLTQSQPQYNPEFDVEPIGIVVKSLGLNDFRTYGVQFRYNYN